MPHDPKAAKAAPKSAPKSQLSLKRRQMIDKIDYFGSPKEDHIEKYLEAQNILALDGRIY